MTSSRKSPEPDRDASITEATGRLQDSSPVDMEALPVVVASSTQYTGAIFHVDNEQIRLPLQSGDLSAPIKRQVVKHAPAVVMLIHDCVHDEYLLEREYRAGSHTFAFGIPAGLIDDGETPHDAALRELHEETGVVAVEGDYSIDEIGAFYSSEGMTDELVTIMVIHLAHWQQRHTHFDRGEFVQSTWIDWNTLNTIGIRSSNSIIALKHEALRRITAPEK
ncbi:MAG: NUDIX hydrolase [Bifidobacteriaceae bacterium]|nr:NUDIX hydrolase [Bifidobacteriaceae bacterium]